jgi:hypothetical protein
MPLTPESQLHIWRATFSWRWRIFLKKSFHDIFSTDLCRAYNDEFEKKRDTGVFYEPP